MGIGEPCGLGFSPQKSADLGQIACRGPTKLICPCIFFSAFYAFSVSADNH